MSRRRSGPPKSANNNIEKLPIEANVATLALAITLSANANTDGITIAARTERFAAESHVTCTREPYVRPLERAHAPHVGGELRAVLPKPLRLVHGPISLSQDLFDIVAGL